MHQSSVLRRSREEIMIGILKSCLLDDVTVSQLMVSQNLSYSLLKKHLNRLATTGLIVLSNNSGKKLISTTDHGTAVLKSHRNTIALLNGHKEDPLISRSHV